MARQELNKGNGILFYEEEVKSDKAPEMTGRIHIDCPECGRSTMQRLAGWWHKKGSNEFLKVTHSDFQKKGSRDDDRNDRGSRRGGGRRRDNDDDDRQSRRGGSRDGRDDDRRSDRDDDRRPPPRDEDYREPADERGSW